MIASIISSVKLLPWRSPHRTSTTEARAGPNRVATLGDAWMRCRSISCTGLDHLPKPDLPAIAVYIGRCSGDITSGFTIFSWSGGARPRAGDLLSGFGVVAGVLLALTLRSILSRSEWERREQIS